jgi:membrane-bound lytic murein transglycosylase A
LWIDDPLDLFFMQVQGSGQVALDDGSRVRVGYADQNGYPYRSIGKWLVDQGELKMEQASMAGIKAWARAHPSRLPELLNANPSLVFFRELPLDGSGPPGALGVPLTAERSIAVDPRQIALGAPVFLATTWPSDTRPLRRLMLAQDTGGAIRGVVRADFYWGSGPEAGSQAGRMRQKGAMWLLMPRAYAPN